MNSFTVIACTALLTAAVLIQPQATAQQQYTAGDTVCFTVAAIDANGDTIRDWDQTGQPCSITLVGSTANTDTSEQTWSKHPDGFSYAVILHNSATLATLDTNQWALPANIFTDGKATLCLVHTKADTGVYITLCPDVTELRTDSVRYHYQPGPVENFLVEITSATSEPDQVYLRRKYELVVIPRDRYLNSSYDEVQTYFSARYVAEMYSACPGLSDLFSGAIFISGPTNYFLMSTTVHDISEGQWILVRGRDSTVRGISNQYAILEHAPTPFTLTTPVDGTHLELVGKSIPAEFDWTSSRDPYQNINISRITGELGNDLIRYKIEFTDSVSLSKRFEFDSDSNGITNKFTTTHGALHEIGKAISGDSTYSVKCLWTVLVMGGLPTAVCNPTDTVRADPGHFLILIVRPGDAVSPIPSAPTGIALHQNFPNPVAAGGTANIRFETTAYGPVAMKVYNMLGSEVATLANETLAPGAYNADFSATGIAPGVYHYTLIAGGQTTTRSMVVTK